MTKRSLNILVIALSLAVSYTTQAEEKSKLKPKTEPPAAATGSTLQDRMNDQQLNMTITSPEDAKKAEAEKTQKNKKEKKKEAKKL